MKIEVIHDFKDAEHDLTLQSVGDKLEVTVERGKYLINFGVVKEIHTDQEGGDPKISR